MLFAPRRSIWFGLITWLLMPLLVGLDLYLRTWVGTAACLFAWGLALWLWFSTRYVLQPSDLLVRSGPTNLRIPYTEIRHVRPSRNPEASAALSLDRLEIKYGLGKTVLIAPREKAAFLAALQERCGGLQP